MRVGNVFKALRLIPVLASLADWCRLDIKVEHLPAHRIMELRPSEQIKAHRRTERTITTFASKTLVVVVAGGGGDVGGGCVRSVRESDLLV